PEGISGGILGVAIIGIQRALFSNVAGVGTAALAHGVTKNRRPAEEGLVAAWEPFWTPSLYVALPRLPSSSLVNTSMKAPMASPWPPMPLPLSLMALPTF